MHNAYTGTASIGKSWIVSGLSAEIRANLFGPQALPEGRSRTHSPVFAIYDLNLSKSFQQLRLSLAVDNLADWVQPDAPLTASADGSGQVVDSALIYGPLIGRVFRVNLNYILPLGR